MIITYDPTAEGRKAGRSFMLRSGAFLAIGPGENTVPDEQADEFLALAKELIDAKVITVTQPASPSKPATK